MPGKLDIFLELVGKAGSQIKGESQDAAFPYHIELKSFSLSCPPFTTKGKKAKSSNDGEGGKKKKPKGFTFSIKKEVDKSSPVLVQMYSKNLGSNAEPFSKAIVRFRLPHVETHLVFLAMLFTDVHLTKYDMEINEETSIPQESLKFSFKTLAIQYAPQSSSGDVQTKADGDMLMKTATWPPASNEK